MAEGSKDQPARESEQLLPIDQLTRELRNLAEALGERILSSATEKIGGLTSRLTDYAQGGGSGGSGGSGALGLIGSVIGSKHPVAAGLKGAAKMAAGGLMQKITGGGKGGKGKKLKLINIVETLDMGAPRRLVYDQWTQFQDFPSFMKKVEGVDQQSDEKTTWKAQVFWSHRTWESTIVEQVPDQRIIWRSKGAKGYVDGAVTFHELSPDMTRVLLVLEYHPQGLFERTGNIWRAQGRRARLEFKHFRRHVMMQALLHPDEIEGWRGEIRDSKVVKDHETALREEQEQEEREKGPEEEPEEPGREEETAEELEGEPEEGEPEEGEPEEEPEEERGETEEEPEEEEEPEPEPEEEEPEEPEQRRRPVRRRRREAEAEADDRPPPRPARRRAAARGA
ncbi:SRPBCC family protein [Streptosporangium roseum]|uniref:Integral membrane protein-like protein n=1 Tax=Streptosporangium roseum (strain ATCC 12428 / DSM 43021 / JCM 3005 / KCTC 9067 / NCIMB 10171 / NRRL 2505 / NI 9100) TaxID=479432 RepID=D2B735_STRRD|nr:SRPBCC family protein [Streptosporangium roseum]ACZ89560.1 integral membrane protein-like protein [Streptosporangium roseum DSM 43021]